MSRLESRYKEQIDFVHINWDDPDSRLAIEYFRVLTRSTYLLLAPDGTVLWQLVGPLNVDIVEEEFLKALEEYSSN